jgi:ABC-type nitrate/sulfonate/bicarbonate transport system substrate-binding protein
MIALFLFFLFIFADAPSAAAPIRISYSALAPIMAGLWIADDIGAFKKQGLDTQLIYIPASATNVQALIAGSLEIATPGSSGAVISAARGAPVVSIGSLMNRPPMTLYVQPEISKAEGLKGQSIGITRFNSSTHLVAVLVLRKLGLEKSVTLRPLGGVPEMQAAFEQKQIAGMFTSLRPKPRSNGLLNAAEMDIPYAINVIAATRDYVRAHPETVDKFMRGYIEGVAAMIRDKERTMKVLGKYLKRSEPSSLEEMYVLAAKYTERVPRVDPRIISTILEFGELTGLNPDTVAAAAIDNSFVDSLVREKFIEKTFGEKPR